MINRDRACKVTTYQVFMLGIQCKKKKKFINYQSAILTAYFLFGLCMVLSSWVAPKGSLHDDRGVPALNKYI
jgi:hypothetical protein